MSFLRPTESSLRRAQTIPEERPRQTVSVSPSTCTTGAARPPHNHPVVHDAPVPDYSHVPSRVDSGLHSRVQTSSLMRRRGKDGVQTDPSAHSPSLREFTTKCDHVVQRAQTLLDRTREQELQVAKALEERLSQSPARRADTPSPPLSQGDGSAPQQTPTRWFGGFSSSSKVSPTVPAAPYTTPVNTAHAAEEGFVGGTPAPAQRPSSPSPSRLGLGEWLGLRAPSPSLPALPAPPPTPAAPSRGFSAAGPATAVATSPTTTTGSAKKTNELGSPSSPSLLQRIRRTLQRMPEGSVDASPVPLSPDVVAQSIEAIQNASNYKNSNAGRLVPASPRKSVKFVSPDKLESVTPTKMVVFPESDSSCSEEEEEEEEEAARASVRQPPPKKTRVEKSRSATPKRDSVGVPPAPPPSAVKSPAKKHGDVAHDDDDDCSTSSRRSSLSLSPRASGNRSESRGTGSSRAYMMHHDELKAYVMQHTVRQSLTCLSKSEMKRFLKEEGSPLATQHHVLKKQLLAEIRALLRKQAEA
ncbi:hypothetical protein ABL78_2194 [Leptomonas seymouri]|uniref:Uncharacterized protein n=1 Tax=Leptomonas seymouri TaxID=5684 RepID=A0A0N1I6G4_LEPSE|nr:hypothetical protein ABL78_2194 [Leptomonas seymouri]|eukprot:KPI88734.1 hypothetical protein ABL78_2194 [Leptomonas seymouri]